MLDIKLIIENSEKIKEACRKRGVECDIDKILDLDERRRNLLQKVEKLRAQKNLKSKEISKSNLEHQLDVVKRKIPPTLMQKIVDIQIQKEERKKLEPQLKKIEDELNNNLSELPNIVAEDVLAGGKENNKVLKKFGKKPSFSARDGFKIKDHIQLTEDLNIIDYERGAKIAGSGFWFYKGEGAVLEWALLNYFIDFHRKNKYEFLLPPFLLTEESAFVSGHLPKFKDDLYWTQDKLCLNATSEMMLLNYHRDEVLQENELPKKYFSYSPCFRREGGGYRKEERGMIRGHQFNKIEMFQFVKPEKSWQAFNELVKNAEKLVDGLGLHFQSVQLAAGDMAESMVKTIDIEVFLPSINIFKEISSVSNALDYQARRGNIKYRNNKTQKNEFLHTLNGSGLATSRLIPAILEQFQQKDGSVLIPKVLHKYTKFKKISRT